jgi:hypothetical protein
MMHYILYQTTNLINNKIYIGIHKTSNLNDGYLGSGTLLKKSIAKHGPENFIRTILAYAETYEDLLTLERQLVTEEFVLRRDTYNLELGGKGGKVWTPELRDKMSKTKKSSYISGEYTVWNKGLKTGPWTEDRKSSRKGINSGEKNPMYGKPPYYKMSESEKTQWANNISKSNTGKRRTAEQKKNYSQAASSRIWLVDQFGTVTHTTNKNDPRLNSVEWQRGRKWKS